MILLTFCKPPCSYSLLWPCEDLRRGDECTRDFLKGITEDKQRSSRLTAWFHTPSNYFEQVISDCYPVYQRRSRFFPLKINLRG